MPNANQLYRQSGSKLSFKDWINREQEKIRSANASADGNAPINIRPSLNDSVQNTINSINGNGVQTELSGKTIFGINKNVVITTAVITVIGIAVVIFYKRKKN